MRWPLPANQRALIELLQSHGVVNAQTMAFALQMVGMHNILVHEYDKIDDAVVFGVLRRYLVDICAYALALDAAHRVTSGSP